MTLTRTSLASRFRQASLKLFQISHTILQNQGFTSMRYVPSVIKPKSDHLCQWGQVPAAAQQTLIQNYRKNNLSTWLLCTKYFLSIKRQSKTNENTSQEYSKRHQLSKVLDRIPTWQEKAKVLTFF